MTEQIAGKFGSSGMVGHAGSCGMTTKVQERGDSPSHTIVAHSPTRDERAVAGGAPGGLGGYTNRYFGYASA